MIHLQYIGLLLACIGRTVVGGLLPEVGPNGGYQYNRPSGGQDFGNIVGGVGELGAGNRRSGYSDRFGSGFTGNGFGTRPSTAYGVPSSSSSFGNSPLAPGSAGLGNYNNNAAPGFGNRLTGSYAQSAGGFTGGPQSGGYQQANGVGGFPGGYQTTGSDAYYQGAGRYNEDEGRPRPYSFQYEVRDPPSGNDYAQQESSDGNVVRGEYRVLLPDSRTQIVKYTADDANGYNADVQYEGQAQFPRGGAGGGGAQGGYNQFALDGGYPSTGGFGPVNNYQGGRGGFAGGLGPGGIFPSGGGINPAVGGNTEPASNTNRYLPPGNSGYGK
ncbi:adult-specific cuticular protein ACP-20-like [Venturia canescens]|uniref:adult-specific cuticular protein ACP-20-like n=1 Tax=Venturia canescens TaxID=32260 RepID=UPI001C9D356D|nr:adult-specific cuticular protein ACP-20-like [Venturia canescens]